MTTDEPGDVVVRAAQADDLAGIAEIRNDAVLHSTAVWTDTPFSMEQTAAWLDELIERDAVVVAEDPGLHGPANVAGYAYFGPWRPREGYRYTVEDSVYLRPEYFGRRLGRALLSAVIERARRDGAHSMVACVESGNLASIRLHESLGFVDYGTLPEVGFKFGRWLDLTQLRLAL